MYVYTFLEDHFCKPSARLFDFALTTTQFPLDLTRGTSIFAFFDPFIYLSNDGKQR